MRSQCFITAATWDMAHLKLMKLGNYKQERALKKW